MRDSVIKIVRKTTERGRRIFRFYLTFVSFLVFLTFIWGLTNIRRDFDLDSKIIEQFEDRDLESYIDSTDGVCGIDLSKYKIDINNIYEKDQRYYYRFEDSTALLTLDSSVQNILKRRLSVYNLPFAAAIVMEAQTGRILGMYETGDLNTYSIKKAYRSASIFKVITMETLLSEKNINPDEVMCYHGGKRRLNRNLLIENKRRDYRCMPIEKALGHSANVIFARLAYRYIDREMLINHSHLFGFSDEIPFELDVEKSHIEVPEDREELAYTAAGFGETYITPLGGAIIASIIANRGNYIGPAIIKEIRDRDNNLIYSHTPQLIRKVMDEEVAARLTDMMRYTVTEGTAHKYFARRRPVDFIREIPVAGKTGSLAEKEGPYREYNWFVGFAPANNPEYVISVLTINSENISARAVLYARMILEDLFVKEKKMIVKKGAREEILSKR